MTQFVGRRLRALRTRCGVSPEELAVMAGVSAAAVARYEQDRAVPGLNAAVAIAATLGADVTHLLDDGPGPAVESHSIGELPAWAQKLIGELRRDSARNRVKARSAAGSGR